MKCHFLMLSVATGGNVMPWAGLATELVRRGHQLSFTTTDQFAHAIEGPGREVLRYASTPRPAIKDNPGQFSEIAWGVDESSAIMDAVKTRFSGTRPDVILYDTSAYHAGRVLSQIWELPAIMLHANFASSPHYSMQIDITNRSVEGSAPDMTDYMDHVERFMSSHGPDLTDTAELLGGVEELIVVTLPREFQIAGDTFDERSAFVGPCLDDRAFQGQWQPPGEDPVLLVSFGSWNYKGQLAFLETCVSAFAGLSWHVVMSTGPELDPAELGPLPPNIEAHRQVPQLAILKKAKLFVSHAGMGGILEALSVGVPVLGFPRMPEQDIAADRIVELGLGRKGALDISADELRAAVLDLAADPSTTQALTQMREHIRKAGGAPRAAEEIEMDILLN